MFDYQDAGRPASTAAPPPRLRRLQAWLGLQHNIVVMLTAVLLVGLGENLWVQFLPKYLQALGAGAWIIAAYGSLVALLDAVYQYPSGWLADHLGRRRSLALLTLLAAGGYAIYLLTPSWQGVLLGTFCVGATWSSLTLPGTFAVIGDSLPQARRGIAFGVQTFLERVPRVVMPALGGWLITGGTLTLVKQPQRSATPPTGTGGGGGGTGAHAGQGPGAGAHAAAGAHSSILGLIGGMRVSLAITLVFALIAAAVIWRCYVEPGPRGRGRRPLSVTALWRSVDAPLKLLLTADCLSLWGEGLIRVSLVLYVLDVLKGTALQFGLLTGVEALVSLVVFIPGAKLADRWGRRPLILVMLACFALFPLLVVSAPTVGWLAPAFALAGLRGIGEPARRALIVDWARETARGRVVGLYHLIRGLVIFPAALVGGWFWTLGHQAPFYAACAIGAVGVLTYALGGRAPRGVTAPAPRPAVARRVE